MPMQCFSNHWKTPYHTSVTLAPMALLSIFFISLCPQCVPYCAIYLRCLRKKTALYVKLMSSGETICLTTNEWKCHLTCMSISSLHKCSTQHISTAANMLPLFSLAAFISVFCSDRCSFFSLFSNLCMHVGSKYLNSACLFD